MRCDMMKKQFFHLLPILLLLTLWSSGCAHKPAGHLNKTLQDVETEQSSKTAPDKTEGLSSTSNAADDIENEFFEKEFEKRRVQVADPLYIWNKGMFHFNDKLYFWLIKPLAKGYKAVAPEIFRESVRNFFNNLVTPIRLVNCLLQGKGQAAASEFTKFVINTTIGLLGLGNPASQYPQLYLPDDEDLGQTLAKYGIGNGFYIVWPILGPSTLRDSIGLFGDSILYPVNYVKPVEVELGIRGVDLVNQTSFHIGEYEALKEASVDPYVAIRNSYLQFRERKIKQ
jgi:phospholipid-binding lipoprotein MlaA